MKRMVRSIFVIMICSIIFLLSAVGVNATGEPTVVYDGEQKEFTLVNVTDTNLFPLYENMIPGDNIVQNIVLKVKNLKETTRVYLRAECTDEVKKALEGTTIDVYCKDKLIVDDEVIFDDILVGKYNKKETSDLKSCINIPTSNDNEISDREYKIQWIFTVQEDFEEKNTYKTGDDFNMLIYAAAIVIAIGIILLALNKKRKA